MSDRHSDYVSQLQQNDPVLHQALLNEERRQRDGIELVPAENYTYPEVLGLLGSVFTNKYSEGYPGARYYGGQEFTDAIDKSVFPGLQGGPHMNQVAATAFTLLKAQQPEFQDYCRQVLANAQTLAATLSAHGVELITGGTQNHLLVLNVKSSFGCTGREAQELLDQVGITTNKQVIPDDPLPPATASGLRAGTPAATTRGMGTVEMERIAGWIAATLKARGDSQRLMALGEEIRQFCRHFPVPGLTS